MNDSLRKNILIIKIKTVYKGLKPVVKHSNENKFVINPPRVSVIDSETLSILFSSILVKEIILKY